MMKQRFSNLAVIARIFGIEITLFIILFVFLIVKSYILLFIFMLLVGLGIYFFFKSRKLHSFVFISFYEHKITAIIISILLFLILPLLFPGDAYTLHVLVICCIQIIAVLGLNFQVGSAGLPNLGFAAFYGVGAYTSALLAVDLGLTFWTGLTAAAIVSAAFGLVLGFPALKTRPIYLALVTLAFGLVVYNLFLNLGFFHGPDGVRNIPPPKIMGWSVFSDITLLGITYPSQITFYYFSLFFLIIGLIIAYFIYNSQSGLMLNAIREDEIASRSVGINVSMGKLIAFSIGSLYGGVAGCLYAHYIGYISAQNFTITVSFAFLAMVILGGSDNVMGVTFAAFLLTVLPEKFRALSDYRVIAYGIIIVVMLIFRPEGLLPQRIRDYSFVLGNSDQQVHKNV